MCLEPGTESNTDVKWMIKGKHPSSAGLSAMRHSWGFLRENSEELAAEVREGQLEGCLQ